jgi:hypothetical protein
MSLWGPFANFSLPLCILHRKYYYVSAFHSHSEKFGIGDCSTHFGKHLIVFGSNSKSSEGSLDHPLPNLSVVFEYQFLLRISQCMLGGLNLTNVYPNNKNNNNNNKVKTKPLELYKPLFVRLL